LGGIVATEEVVFFVWIRNTIDFNHIRDREGSVWQFKKGGEELELIYLNLEVKADLK